MSASPGPQSAQHCPIVQSCWESNKTSDDVRQSFSTFLLHRNLPQMYALLMEPYPMIQVSILWQPHRTMVANFVSGKFGLFQRNPWQALSEPWGSAELRLKKKNWRMTRWWCSVSAAACCCWMRAWSGRLKVQVTFLYVFDFHLEICYRFLVCFTCGVKLVEHRVKVEHWNWVVNT